MNNQGAADGYLRGSHILKMVERNKDREIPKKYMMLGSKIAFDALQIAKQTHAQMVREVALEDRNALFPSQVPPHVQDKISAASIMRWCRHNADQLGGYDDVMVTLTAIRVSAMIAMIRQLGNELWLQRWITLLPAAPGTSGSFDINGALPVACGKCKLEIVHDEDSGEDAYALDIADLRRLLDLAPRLITPS